MTHHIKQTSQDPIHYWLEGKSEGEVLLFLHGATMDHDLWSEQIDAFVEAYRLLLIDLPAHGQPPCLQ